LIVIVIISILVGFGISAYGKARDHQAGTAAGEQILSILQENQKIANIGDVDSSCTGVFTGQKVVFFGANSYTTQNICTSSPGVISTVKTIPDIISLTSATIIFKPMSGGITLPSNPLILNYATASSSYAIKINQSGTIEYLGIQ